MRPRAPVVGLAVAVSGAIACNALTGIGDLAVGDLGSDAGVDSGPAFDAFVAPPTDGPVNADDDSGGDADTDAEIPVEAGPDAPTGVTCEGAGGTCAPAVPDGWGGPFLVYDGADTKSLPGCPSPLTSVADVGVGTPTQSFTCGSCRCGGVNGATCAATLSSFGDSAACDPATVLGSEAITVTCISNTTGADLGAQIAVSQTAPGSCTPQLNGPPTKGTLSWTSMKRVCGSDSLTAIGCSSPDRRCLPPPNGPAKICIALDNGTTCPDPWTGATPAFYDVSDSRTCSATGCSCDTPTGVTCGGTFKLFGASTTCFGPLGGMTEPVNTCFDLPNGGSVKANGNVSASGGSCNASGTADQGGNFGPGNGTLICCLP